jgi:hypothetical protein
VGHHLNFKTVKDCLRLLKQLLYNQILNEISNLFALAHGTKTSYRFIRSLKLAKITLLQGIILPITVKLFKESFTLFFVFSPQFYFSL